MAAKPFAWSQYCGVFTPSFTAFSDVLDAFQTGSQPPLQSHERVTTHLKSSMNAMVGAIALAANE